MLDFGMIELVLVLAIAVFVIGPDEIPSVLKSMGKFFRKIQRMKSEFSYQIDEFMHDDDMDEFQKKHNERIMTQHPLTQDEQAEVNRAMVESRDPDIDGKKDV